MKESEDKIRKFIDKISEIQNLNEEKGLSEQDLKEIAFEMGMTGEEWRKVEKTFNDYLTRGKGFLKYRNWDDALYELQQASALYPDHVDVLYHLALAYEGRWLGKRDKDDRNKAEECAKKCIQINPAHQGALKLISSLKRRQRPVNKTRILIGGIVLVLAVFAVRALLYFMQQGTPKAPDSSNTSTSTSTSATLTLNKMLLPYIVCINRHSKRIYQSYNRYLSWIDHPETGPTVKDSPVYGLYDIYDSKKHLNDIKIMNEQAAVYPDLGKKGKEYHGAFENLKPILAEALGYYDLDNYLDDDFKKGKELHAPLVFAFKKYIRADRALRTYIEELQADAREKSIESLAGEKRNSKEYQILYLARSASLVILEALAVDKDLEKKDSFLAALEIYEKAFSEFSYLAETNESKWNVSVTFTMDYKEFEKALTLYRRAVEKGNTRERYRTGTIYEQVVDDFNSTVSTCNDVIKSAFPSHLIYLWFIIPPEPIYPVD